MWMWIRPPAAGLYYTRQLAGAGAAGGGGAQKKQGKTYCCSCCPWRAWWSSGRVRRTASLGQLVLSTQHGKRESEGSPSGLLANYTTVAESTHPSTRTEPGRENPPPTAGDPARLISAASNWLPGYDVLAGVRLRPPCPPPLPFPSPFRSHSNYTERFVSLFELPFSAARDGRFQQPRTPPVSMYLHNRWGCDILAHGICTPTVLRNTEYIHIAAAGVPPFP